MASHDNGAIRKGGLRTIPEPRGAWSQIRKLAGRLSLLHVLLGVVAGAALAGWSVARWESGRASRDDLMPLVEVSRDHEGRLIRLETDLGWIKQTLYEMARRAGLSPTPPPP
ncbi:MAG: hypothetical protein AAB706_03435 [Patescibacteria group bacterium]